MVSMQFSEVCFIGFEGNSKMLYKQLFAMICLQKKY